MKIEPDEAITFYESSVESLGLIIDGLREDQRALFLMAFQKAWQDVAIEILGSAHVTGIYDAAIEELEGSMPSRMH